MNRKDFLKKLLITGSIAPVVPALISSCGSNKDDASLLIALAGASATTSSDSYCDTSTPSNSSVSGPSSCSIIPEETTGPYPLDLGSNCDYFRSDITESYSGLPLALTLTVINTNNSCKPITNARVDIWHCNKDGYYSGYASQPGYLGTKSYLGKTFFRGIQLTDVNGQVTFNTIYPGWYTSRVTHIHVQVYLNNSTVATSQIAFPDSVNLDVYTNNSLYTAHGMNSITSNTSDSVFGDSASDLANELCTISGDSSTGYTASLTLGIAMS